MNDTVKHVVSHVVPQVQHRLQAARSREDVFSAVRADLKKAQARRDEGEEQVEARLSALDALNTDLEQQYKACPFPSASSATSLYPTNFVLFLSRLEICAELHSGLRSGLHSGLLGWLRSWLRSGLHSGLHSWLCSWLRT